MESHEQREWQGVKRVWWVVAFGIMATGLLSCERHVLCGGRACAEGQRCEGEVCTVICPDAQKACEGLCISVERDAQHCGACGKTCAVGQTCVNGVCTWLCPADQKTCGGLCISVERDVQHCGGCGLSCGVAEQCNGGVCGCVPPLVRCGKACVDERADGRHCGGCGKACPSGQVCSEGSCVTSCPAKTPHICNGGCVEPGRDLLHCGGCGKACEAGKFCVEGGCSCIAGLATCDGRCTDNQSDRRHCGGCGKACQSGEVCALGHCVASCPAATALVCLGGCVDSQTNPLHCGGCGKACQGGETCQKGRCERVCGAGQGLCETRCVDLQTDVRHCGGCDQPCEGTFNECWEGRCALICRGGKSLCQGACIETQTDAKNCGSCGIACPQGQSCEDGTCVFPAPIVETVAGIPPFRDGQGTQARFSYPSGIALDSAGNLSIADTENQRLRKLDPQGNVTTLAGNGAAGFQDGAAALANFKTLSGVALDAAGNVYIADRGNHRIRKLDTAGNVTTFAGSGIQGHLDGSAGVAQFHFPGGLASDGAGNLFVADTTNHRIRKIDGQGNVSTFAGSGIQGDTNGPPTTARFFFPTAITIDKAGNVYIADSGNYLIRKISPQGNVSTIAGRGLGFQDGPAMQAQFRSPAGLALDAAGNLYIADRGNHRLRKLDTAGNVTTLAGKGTRGVQDGPAATSSWTLPEGIAVDGAGNVYVADTGSGLLRKIDPQGQVTTLAGGEGYGYKDGSASDAIFNEPSGMDFDEAGNLYISDTQNFRIRKLDIQGRVTTIAGDGVYGYKDGPGAVAQFRSAWGLAVEKTGQIYVADTNNNRIRKIDPKGVVTTLAGDGTAGFRDGPGTAARLRSPSGVAVDSSGNVYVADRDNHRIRKIDPTGNVTTIAGDGTSGFQDGPGSASRLSSPRNLTLDPAGQIFVADSGNNRIRKIDLQGNVTTVTGSGVSGYQDGSASVAQFSLPYDVRFDTAGEMYVWDAGNQRIRKVDRSGRVTTLAGSGVTGYRDGLAMIAAFFNARNIAVDKAGRVYIADNDNHVIRRWRAK